MQYLAPLDLDSALEAMAQRAWTVLAGGTDFYPARVGLPVNEPVMDISRVRNLRGITVTDDDYRIGALTRWSDIRDADLPRCFDGLRLAAREVGAVQVQNAGTIAGNLCNASPAADGIPPLLTLNASVELTARTGRRVIPLTDFLTGYRQTDLRPGELLTAVIVPRRGEDSFTDFSKLGSRAYLVISIVMVASFIETSAEGIITGARLAVGACSPVAQRLPELEAALVGAHLTDDLEQFVRMDYLAPLSPIDDVRATAAYRRDAALTLLRRSIRKLLSQADDA
ncbi:MAG TPA: xanthine dehydrogenase family protein subunit M [Acidimicrobiia bacterium]|nr:xanthine dehydrogenase family protein subunit M [Acidimicrobiia bacterium]